MAKDLNRVMLTGRLARDPELTHTAGGTAVFKGRLAYTTTRKDPGTGAWNDKSNYIDITAFGKLGETMHTHLAKGKRIGVDGRIEWREWDANDGTKRQAYEVVLDNFVFLDSKGESAGQQSFSGGGDGGFVPAGGGDGGDFQGSDDDIPF